MEYIDKILQSIKDRDPDQKEFYQAVSEVLVSLEPVLSQNPVYEQNAILERMVEPERVIMFKVPWVDDNGVTHINRGYRVQFNGAIGPYKGGLRFNPNVNLSVIKFLGFEQVLKNSLTTLPIGGGKGGSDFDPKGKSDGEVMRFCQSFMSELYKHIGPSVDVPAGDVGVGGREIGYLFGQYRRLTSSYDNGVLTGKPLEFGGSLIRPEATGYGAVYFADEVLKHQSESLKGKTIILSGYGNVSWGVALKARDYGAKVISISGRDGYIYDEQGINTDEKINFMLAMRAGQYKLKDYADKFNAQFYPSEKPWGLKGDIAMPCAIQNEISLEDAKKLVANGVKYVIEGANMPTVTPAIDYFYDNGVILAPGKAANAGGVAVSALEMSQNAMRYGWSKQEVDDKLHQIMIDIHDACCSACDNYHLEYNLVKGANIAGFEKVAKAMIAQGNY